ncbi:hypothetical protein ACTWP5_26275 [Streptomyces sp. 4N509B]|uniref:hypothetical protein n=1 Tax=Streptomyces sp. 4N509B TaxID=3457413 RepID=UPI003FCF61BB
MRRLSLLVALGAAVLGTGMTAAPAHASTGEVVIFTTEFAPLTVHENPRGCHSFPALAHVLNNQTDSTVTIHGDPFCMTPGIRVAPGYGTHVPEGVGSFSV